MAREFKSPAARRSISAEVTSAAEAIRDRYGPEIGWEELLLLLNDRQFVRFPCEIRFEADPLLAGEFAHPVPKGSRPEDGYVICVHPAYADQLARVPYLVLHQLVLVNHGDSASLDDAETFGALVLGLSREEYYQALCQLSGQLGGDELV